MAGFSDAARRLDEEAAAHLGDPARYRVQGAGDGVTIQAMLTRSLNAVAMRDAMFAHEQPVIEALVAHVPGLAAGDLIDLDGRVWRLEGAPLRPDDGAWWRATVADLGPSDWGVP